MMEATQLLDTNESVDEGSDNNSSLRRKLVGILQVDGLEDYNIFQGDAISIGRDPENCHIVLDNKVKLIKGFHRIYTSPRKCTRITLSRIPYLQPIYISQAVVISDPCSD